jgi:hypothetical protein
MRIGPAELLMLSVPQMVDHVEYLEAMRAGDGGG